MKPPNNSSLNYSRHLGIYIIIILTRAIINVLTKPILTESFAISASVDKLLIRKCFKLPLKSWANFVE